MSAKRLIALWFLLLVGCSDPPLEQSDCRFNGQDLEVGAEVLDPGSCQACRCVAAGELSCAVLPNCVPLAPLPDASAPGPGGAGGAGGPDQPMGGGGGPDDPEGPGAGGGGGTPGCPRGNVTGLACAPDGTPIAGARVHAQTTDCGGQPVEREVFAGADGRFRLEGLAPGPTAVLVTAGRFDGRYEVVVVADRSVPIEAGAEKQCIPSDTAEVAAITGDYDSIEAIVGDLGFEYTAYCGDADGNYGARGLLGNYAELSRYDVVLINCGQTLDPDGTADGPQIVQNLQRFVAEGGSLYVSDLAANLVQAAWPDRIGFVGEYYGFGRDACCECTQCPAQCGARLDQVRPGSQCLGTLGGGEFGCEHDTAVLGFGETGRVQAQILDANLQQFLGRNTLDVTFDSDGWVQIESVSAGVEVLVADRGAPLMVMFTDPTSGGRVAYTAFHNTAQASADVQRILAALLFQL